jgi:cysteine desulfurase
MDRIYLDNAASTPMDSRVLDAMLPYFQQFSGNPSSIHADGRKTRHAIEQARKLIANQLNASIGSIFFTSGGTESNNTILYGAVRDLGVRRIISALTEHPCVLNTLAALQRDAALEVVWLPLDAVGRPDMNALETILQTTNGVTTLVSLMHGNNEIGTMIHLKRVAALCARFSAYLHTDTVQTIGRFRFDLSKLPVHFLTGSAHKFHGPKGVGFLYVHPDALIRPFVHGGSQERNFRGGTENVSGIVGLAKAFELAYAHIDERRAYITELKSYFIAQLRLHFSDVVFNGDVEGRSLYSVLSVSFAPTLHTELLVFNLDIAGISASGGSACSSGVEASSHVMAAIKPNDLRKTVRFSLSYLNTRQEIDRTIEVLRGLVREG